MTILYYGSHNQGRGSAFLSEGAGDEWQAPIGGSREGQGWSPLKIFTSTPLDWKKTLFEYQSTPYLR